MLFSHIPMGTTIAAGLGCLIAIMVDYMVAEPMGVPGWGWLAGLMMIAAIHIARSILYFRAKDRQHPRWMRNVKYSIFALSAWWGAMLWMLPVRSHIELQATLIGTLSGLAACGAFMLTVDRSAARIWLMPMLTSVALYCTTLNSVLGLFGAFSITGFMGVLWMETGRAHRRVGELLFLRFTNERITASQAVALREAEELSQAKGQFLATMSHEMRTPLHGILGLSRLIRGELRSQEAHERMNLLESAGQHLLGVINDVLDYSRLQAGRIELSPAPVNLPDLAREVTSLAAVNGTEKGLDVVLDSELPSDYLVHVDGGRLKQILLNLLGNAVKFTEQGRVTMRLFELPHEDGQPSRIGLEVADTGIGIPEDELARVFDAFHQVDGRYERKAAGSGLGLSIAREICVAMGGELTCDSQPGEGSTFRCVLPLARMTAHLAQPATKAASAATPVAMTPGKAPTATVLLVEDNPVNAIVALTELEQMGLRVAHAENGQLALEWLARHEADLVLMDCHMPEMNGFDATRHIRMIESQRGVAPVPIVALTASTQQEVQQECLQAGMNDCLSKPFLRGDLLRVVKRYVTGGARRSDRQTQPLELALAS
ncbi:MAG TPA: ATP-binding protein [Aquabacterium sp.]|uniref:ATP-binding protein n=1 Tax=Aquabacterium sp. TaxID=1872578 RepID=UPI002E35A852|nr:ATP-binding protein [Aquabacterium sp.]HEX5373608.1 ATP-binding protein [Aquabacterium sp.]